MKPIAPALRALALDIATTTGWATVGGGVVTSGSQNFSRDRGSSTRPAQHPGEPFAAFRTWVGNKVREDKPAVIIYEEVMRFPYALQAHSFCGFRAQMLTVACEHNIPCISYGVTTVKKFWAGKGNADKDQMVAATLIRCPGIDLTDDNEADALAVMHLYLSER